MIARLFAMLIVAVLGLGLGAPAHAHGGDYVGATRAVTSVSSHAPAAGPQAIADVAADLAFAVAGIPYDLAPAAPAADHCHCDGGVCSAAAPLPPSAGRDDRQPRRDARPLADQVAALNVVDPPLQPPEH